MLTGFWKPSFKKVLLAFILEVLVISLSYFFVKLKTDWHALYWNDYRNVYLLSLELILTPLLPMFLLFWNSKFVGLVVISFFTYWIACFIFERKKGWLKGIIFICFFLTFFSFLIGFIISLYNSTVGVFCLSDSDCKYVYGLGVKNRFAIKLKKPYFYEDFPLPGEEKCIRLRCRYLR